MLGCGGRLCSSKTAERKGGALTSSSVLPGSDGVTQTGGGGAPPGLVLTWNIVSKELRDSARWKRPPSLIVCTDHMTVDF